MRELRKQVMKIRLQGQPVDPVAGTSGEIVTREELQRNCRGAAEELQKKLWSGRHLCGLRAGAEQCHEAAAGGIG